MSSTADPLPASGLRDVALAAIAQTCARGVPEPTAPEDRVLLTIYRHVTRNGQTLSQALNAALRGVAAMDKHLVRLGEDLRLTPAETLAVALAAAVEEDPLVGRVLAHVQAPVGGSRPSLGLMSQAFGSAFEGFGPVLPALLNGAAAGTGLLALLGESAPLPERTVAVPLPLCLALAGSESPWPGASIGLDGTPPVPLPDSAVAQSRWHAAALGAEPHRALVLRGGSPAEGRSVAAGIAAALGCRPLFIDTDKITGLGPWLTLRRLLPVFSPALGPGERRVLPALPGYRGPVLAVCGPDGAVETAHGTAASWTIAVPSRAERAALWTTASADPPLAERLAREHRHSAGRIAHLGRLAAHQAALAGRRTPDHADVTAAAWTGEGSGLESLAEPLRSRVPDEALVTTAELRAQLETLMVRCLVRDDLVTGLGAAAATRYRPGVRALFTGPSGTGKTLAAGWIATRLGMPLYRVDLASVTSKYIGETEKNLSQLLSRAEQAEVILLFDEADSLFGKRTDVNDSNDRFANAQTNYLLQRIESYDGIVLLTSNSQARFDTAFTRRLDFIVEFPPPAPAERRALWQAHLGPHATLDAVGLNRLAALVDLPGGHIRNAVLAAAVRARRETRSILFGDLVAGAEAELGKLGRQLPVELRASLSG